MASGLTRAQHDAQVGYYQACYLTACLKRVEHARRALALVHATCREQFKFGSSGIVDADRLAYLDAQDAAARRALTDERVCARYSGCDVRTDVAATFYSVTGQGR
jgi:hypothetical protein